MNKPKNEKDSFFKKESGVSLVEAILVILIVGMTALLIGSLPNSFSLIGKSSHEAVAKEIALKKIEGLRSQTYDNLANGTSVLVDSRLSNLPTGSGQVTIGDCPNNVCTNGELIKQVDVNVDWVEAGKPREVKISTFIAKGGLQ